MASGESKRLRRYDKENLLWQSTVAIKSAPVGSHPPWIRGGWGFSHKGQERQELWCAVWFRHKVQERQEIREGIAMQTTKIVRQVIHASRYYLMVMIGAFSVSASGATPIAVSMGGCFPSNDVCGVHLSVVGMGPDTVEGLSLGAINSWHSRELRGISVVGIQAGDECVKGVQIGGAFALAEKASGLQLGGIASVTVSGMTGVQIAGLLSQAASSQHAENRGLQIACYNGAVSMCGVQIGLINFACPAKDGWVVQIGLINGISHDEDATYFSGMRYMPIVNVGW